jgi:hypothetical protein
MTEKKIRIWNAQREGGVWKSFGFLKGKGLEILRISEGARVWKSFGFLKGQGSGNPSDF